MHECLPICLHTHTCYQCIHKSWCSYPTNLCWIIEFVFASCITHTHILCQIKPDVCTLRVLADLVSKNMVFGAMLCFRAETYGPVGVSSCLSKQKRRSFQYCFFFRGCNYATSVWRMTVFTTWGLSVFTCSCENLTTSTQDMI